LTVAPPGRQGKGTRAVHTCCVCIMLALGASCQAGVWVAGPSHKVLRTERAPSASGLYSTVTSEVVLYAARNEFVAFQVVLPGPLRAVNAKPVTLSGPDGTTLRHVDLFREHYVSHPVLSQGGGDDPVRDCLWFDRHRRAHDAPRDFPVQLVPLDARRHAAPFDVAEGQNEVVWVDIFVPPSAPPGIYRGTLRLGPARLQVKLTVWNFTLPSVSHFPNWVYTGPEFIAWAFGKKHTAIGTMMPTFNAYFEMAHNHRVCLAEGLVYDVAAAQAADRRYVEHYSGTAFRGPFAAGFGYELLPVEPACLPLVEKYGWFNRAFVYLDDEPNSIEDYQTVLRRGRDVAAAGQGNLRRMVTEQFRPSRTNWPSLDPAVDIFCAVGASRADVRAIEAAGNVAWTYNGGNGGSPYSDAPGPAMRAHAWAGFVTGTRAWYFWNGTYVVDKFNRWRGRSAELYRDPARALTDLWTNPLTFDESTRPWKDGKLYPARWSLRLNGDGLLFYPGRDAGVDGPLACFRLKNLRRGTQDFEYLYLLEKMGQRDAALAEAERLVGRKRTDALRYEPDPAAWDAARYRLGRRLHDLGDSAIRARVKDYNRYPNPVGHPAWYDGRRH